MIRCDLSVKPIRYKCIPCESLSRANEKTPKDAGYRTYTFHALDEKVLARTDAMVANEFPFILTRKSSMAKTKLTRLAEDLLNGEGFSPTSKFIHQAYSNTYMKLYRSYVSLVNLRLTNINDEFGESSVVPLFRDIGDTKGFNSCWPSPHYLSDVWSK